MKDAILMRQILEGLIHNLNNPLNLILGYSHIMLTAHPDSAEAKKIYQAGIRIDETLKELYSRILERSFAEKQEISLVSWLDGELNFLQHCLTLKHSFSFVREDLAETPKAICAVATLARWYEYALIKLHELIESTAIYTGITLLDGKSAVYIRPENELEASAAERLVTHLAKDPDPANDSCLTTVWSAESNTLWGVLG